MQRSAVPLVIVSLFVFSSLSPAQTASKSVSQQASSDSNTTLHVNSNLVLLDVVVTDHKQQAIHGLRADDFTLIEDGKPQKLDRVEEHVTPPSGTRPARPVPRNVFSNESFPSSFGTPTVILIDMLNTPLLDQPVVQEEIFRFIKQSSAATPVAIFGLASRLILLQSFTSDPELLRAAIADPRRGGKHSPTQSGTDSMPRHDGGADTYEDSLAAGNGSAGGLNGSSGIGSSLYAQLQRFEEGVSLTQQQHSALRTLDALDNLARYLSYIPGRKNLIWVSATFPVAISPELVGDDTYDLATLTRLHETSALMSQARVAVYPIDPRRITVVPVFTAANGDRDEVKRARDVSVAVNIPVSEHLTMGNIAQETGGEATFNTNDLSRAIEKAIQSGSSYYTISYIPQNLDWNNKPRKITINASNKSYRLSYRKSYIANQNHAPGRTPAANIAATMKGAMIFGSPIQTALPLEAAIDYNPELEDAPAPKNELGPDASAPFHHYRVDYHVNIKNFGAPQGPDGRRHLSAKFLLLVYNTNGEVMNSVTNVLEGNLSPIAYQSLLQDGIRLHQDVSIPVKGDYVLRMAVQDVNTEQVGGLEVQASSILPPQN